MVELVSVLEDGKIQYSHKYNFGQWKYFIALGLYITPRDDYLTSFLISDRFLYSLISWLGCDIDQLSLVLTGFAACEMLNLPLGKPVAGVCSFILAGFVWAYIRPIFSKQSLLKKVGIVDRTKVDRWLDGEYDNCPIKKEAKLCKITFTLEGKRGVAWWSHTWI